jgi:hypothetical protein
LNSPIPVNNAGFVRGVEKIGDISEVDIDAMFATNVFGLISMTQLLVKGDPKVSCADSLIPMNFSCRLQGTKLWTYYQHWQYRWPRTLCRRRHLLRH